MRGEPVPRHAGGGRLRAGVAHPAGGPGGHGDGEGGGEHDPAAPAEGGRAGEADGAAAGGADDVIVPVAGAVRGGGASAERPATRVRGGAVRAGSPAARDPRRSLAGGKGAVCRAGRRMRERGSAGSVRPRPHPRKGWYAISGLVGSVGRPTADPPYTRTPIAGLRRVGRP